MTEAQPNINVTPLIDVLLVLLIIFMVVSPSKPSAFKAKIPQEPTREHIEPNPSALIVKINRDFSLSLNHENDLGTIAEPQKLIDRLSAVFQARIEQQIFDHSLAGRDDLPPEEKIIKTVLIKAPRNLVYGEVAKVVDAVKTAGANPVGMQIDDLD